MTTQSPLPIVQADRDAAARYKACSASELDEGNALVQAFARHRIEHSTPDRNAVLEEAADAMPCTAEDPNEDDYQRGRFDGIMEYQRAIRALMTTTPEPTECPSCHGLNTSCPDGCGRDPTTGELNGTRLSEPTDPAGPSIEAVMRFAVIDGTEHKYDITNPAGVSEMADAVSHPMARCIHCGQMHVEHDRVGNAYICAGPTGVHFQAALRTPPVLEVPDA